MRIHATLGKLVARRYNIVGIHLDTRAVRNHVRLFLAGFVVCDDNLAFLFCVAYGNAPAKFRDDGKTLGLASLK